MWPDVEEIEEIFESKQLYWWVIENQAGGETMVMKIKKILLGIYHIIIYSTKENSNTFETWVGLELLSCKFALILWLVAMIIVSNFLVENRVETNNNHYWRRILRDDVIDIV